MKKIALLSYLFIIASLFQNCSSQNKDTTNYWESKYHNLKASYSSQWTLMPNIDSENKVLFGVIDKKDGKSYIVKITKDVSKEVLPDSVYYDFFKKSILNENPNNKILKEIDTQFHNDIYHKFEFIIHTKKWGILKQYAYVKRKDDYLTGIQISFPISKTNMNAEIPSDLNKIDKNMMFDEN